MCVLETLSHKLSVQSVGVQVGSGGRPEVTTSDFAAMMAGLPPGPVTLGYAKYVGDEQAARRLYAMLHVLASDWARREGWEVPKGSEQVGRLARKVRDDLIASRGMLSEREAAAWLKVSRRKWREVWQARYHRLLSVGQDWEGDLRRKLSREYYAQNPTLAELDLA